MTDKINKFLDDKGIKRGYGIMQEKTNEWIKISDLLFEFEALSQHDVSGWVAVKDRLPDDDNQVFVRYENGKYGINEWWESDDCWKYKFDNMIVKEWYKPPFH